MTKADSIQPASKAVSASPTDRDPEQQGMQVLIIDDELEIVEEIAEKLEWNGFCCLTETDAKIGLEVFFSNPEIAILITDIRMPGIDGLQLCQRIKDKSVGRNYQLLVMTGHAGMNEAIDALKIGVLDFLIKPIKPDSLVYAVKRAEKHINLYALEQTFYKQLNERVIAKTKSLHLIAQQLDVTNLKLRHANQVKDEFMAMMSHEFKTPLNQIVGLTEILYDKVTDPLHRQYLDNIKDAGLRLTDMVNGILDMISLGSQTAQLTKVEISVDQLVNQVIEVYRSQAVPLQVSIHANDIKGLMFRIDEKYLSTALGQLLCNAIAHSPIGGDVHILTSVDDKVLKISIHDDGIGMSEQDQKKALKPLSQVDGSETRVHGGIGLGLSLAKAIVELHDGELIIDSIVTSGTLVTLVIPNT